MEEGEGEDLVEARDRRPETRDPKLETRYRRSERRVAERVDISIPKVRSLRLRGWSPRTRGFMPEVRGGGSRKPIAVGGEVYVTKRRVVRARGNLP